MGNPKGTDRTTASQNEHNGAVVVVHGTAAHLSPTLSDLASMGVAARDAPTTYATLPPDPKEKRTGAPPNKTSDATTCTSKKTWAARALGAVAALDRDGASAPAHGAPLTPRR